MDSVILSALLSALVINSFALRSQSNRCFCPDLYQPVCGVDGITYENVCKLACEEVHIHYSGECDNRKSLGRCACPINYDPVCGEDGNTYNNACFAGCSRITVSHRGECKYDKNRCKCPQLYEPVCGYNGVTYDNICDLACEGVQLHYMGVCGNNVAGSVNNVIGKCICPSTYKPMCGSDGTTYANACFLKCAGVQQEHPGECKVIRNEKYCRCPSFYHPVCGYDGITYNNACFMLCAGSSLHYTGTCNKNKQNMQFYNTGSNDVCSCPAVYEPVCGFDGNTYRNKCFLICAKVKLEHTGKCEVPKCNHLCNCPTTYQPVCGINSITYRNTCCLLCANVVLSHVGPCNHVVKA